ncbi:hypothetical protein DM02DRAFT_671735 [Periconia macrospinosa]|uniref:RRM domain-containing protein n=1 Tax=Periconia macrospinosa TaxID=97972 RepID=A0A2V1DS85_9PLEO|nr:hypothetical protein DM02DRAFT_671735 [Periconia macrospinosa]
MCRQAKNDVHHAHYGKVILWPVFHYTIPDHPKSKASLDRSRVYYDRVNRAYADKVIKNYKRGDVIWKLKGVPIIVQLTEAEKNRASRAAAASEGGAANNNGAPFHRLFIGNIHFSVTEEDLKEIFSPFGAIEQITLQRDDKIAARSKRYGFVELRTRRALYPRVAHPDRTNTHYSRQRYKQFEVRTTCGAFHQRVATTNHTQ